MPENSETNYKETNTLSRINDSVDSHEFDNIDNELIQNKSFYS